MGVGASWGQIARPEPVGGFVETDAALPDLPDLAYRSGRVRYQNVTLGELGRMSVSQ